MLSNPIAENVFGTLGTICWTVQLVPQIWKSWREKSTEGLSPWLVLLWGVSAPFLGAYTLILNLSVPLILEPHFFGSLCLVSWCQCQHYAHHRSWRTSTSMTLAIALLLAGFEAGLVFGLRLLFDAGSAPARHATQFLGVFGSVLIGLGLVPQFVEIWRRREVVGISKLLLALDMLGGVCMDLSLAFKDRFNVVTGITYTLIVVLESGLVIAMLILNPRAEKRRQREESARLEA
ncbi:PQ loop repeat-domain-containing protein, partial [Mycena albidolilacea]